MIFKARCDLKLIILITTGGCFCAFSADNLDQLRIGPKQNCVFRVLRGVHQLSMNFDNPIKSLSNSKEFRANLKHYLDVALHEAARVQRKSGDNLIVL